MKAFLIACLVFGSVLKLDSQFLELPIRDKFYSNAQVVKVDNTIQTHESSINFSTFMSDGCLYFSIADNSNSIYISQQLYSIQELKDGYAFLLTGHNTYNGNWIVTKKHNSDTVQYITWVFLTNEHKKIEVKFLYVENKEGLE